MKTLNILRMIKTAVVTIGLSTLAFSLIYVYQLISNMLASY